MSGEIYGSNVSTICHSIIERSARGIGLQYVFEQSGMTLYYNGYFTWRYKFSLY